MEIIQKIVANVLTAVYQTFWFSLVFTVVFMLVLKKYTSVKQAVKEWIFWFKTEKKFRRTFFFVLYTMMILRYTLLNRSMWANPVSNIVGVWWIYNTKGELTTEIFENTVLFIPFSIFYLVLVKDKILRKITFLKTVAISTATAFLLSFTIESLQLFLRLGTWQLSDLFYNTLGGALGGIIFYLCYSAKKNRN